MEKQTSTQKTSQMNLKTFQKLTPYFKSNTIFSQVLKFVQESKIMCSMIATSHQGRFYIMKKDGQIYAPLDWQAFSLMRASSKTILTSGPIVRDEEGLYTRRQSYGDIQIDKFYDAFLGHQVQKLMVLTKTMKKSEIQPKVNPSVYNLIDMPSVDSHDELLQNIEKNSKGKILIECGLNFLEEYFGQVEKGKKNKIDLFMLNKFEGQLPEKYRGKELQIPFQKLYTKLWSSDPYPCKFPNNVQGKLTFHIYTL